MAAINVTSTEGTLWQYEDYLKPLQFLASRLGKGTYPKLEMMVRLEAKNCQAESGGRVAILLSAFEFGSVYSTSTRVGPEQLPVRSCIYLSTGLDSTLMLKRTRLNQEMEEVEEQTSWISAVDAKALCRFLFRAAKTLPTEAPTLSLDDLREATRSMRQGKTADQIISEQRPPKIPPPTLDQLAEAKDGSPLQKKMNTRAEKKKAERVVIFDGIEIVEVEAPPMPNPPPHYRPAPAVDFLIDEDLPVAAKEESLPVDAAAAGGEPLADDKEDVHETPSGAVPPEVPVALLPPSADLSTRAMPLPAEQRDAEKEEARSAQATPTAAKATPTATKATPTPPVDTPAEEKGDKLTQTCSPRVEEEEDEPMDWEYSSVETEEEDEGDDNPLTLTSSDLRRIALDRIALDTRSRDTGLEEEMEDDPAQQSEGGATTGPLFDPAGIPSLPNPHTDPESPAAHPLGVPLFPFPDDRSATHRLSQQQQPVMDDSMQSSPAPTPQRLAVRRRRSSDSDSSDTDTPSRKMLKLTRDLTKSKAENAELRAELERQRTHNAILGVGDAWDDEAMEEDTSDIDECLYVPPPTSTTPQYQLDAEWVKGRLDHYIHLPKAIDATLPAKKISGDLKTEWHGMRTLLGRRLAMVKAGAHNAVPRLTQSVIANGAFQVEVEEYVDETQDVFDGFEELVEEALGFVRMVEADIAALPRRRGGKVELGQKHKEARADFKAHAAKHLKAVHKWQLSSRSLPAVSL